MQRKVSRVVHRTKCVKMMLVNKNLVTHFKELSRRIFYAARREIAEHNETEVQFRILADSIPQLTWMANGKGSIYWYNQRWFQYTGTTPEESLGWGWTKCVHPEHVERVVKRIQHSWDTGESWEDTFPLRSKTGEWGWFLSRALPIRDNDDSIIRWFGTNTDITEVRKARQRAEEANQAKSAFLANMSHEIRTPLGVVIGLAELLVDESIPADERATFVEAITRNGRELATLIDDILDLSKIESGRIETERISISVRKILSEVLDALCAKAHKKGLTITTHWEPNIPKLIQTDPTRLRQILRNIIGNAIKFTDQGEVSIHIASQKEANENKKIVFTVKDTGIGLSEEAKERIFQSFGQADVSTTRKYGGSGLGLILSQRLAQALGGDVALTESAQGKGSTFVITIEA